MGLKNKETHTVKGELTFGLGYFPILPPEKIEHPENYRSGIIRFTLHQAKDVVPAGSNVSKSINLFAEIFILGKGAIPQLEGSKGMITGALGYIPGASFIGFGNNSHQHRKSFSEKEANPSSDNNTEHAYKSKSASNEIEPLFKTKVKKRTNSPIWEATFESFIKDKDKEFLCILLKEERELTGISIVGDVFLPFYEVIKPIDAQKDWYALRTAQSGKLRLSFDWQPIDLSLSDNVLDINLPSIGVLNVTIIEARNLKVIDPSLVNLKAF